MLDTSQPLEFLEGSLRDLIDAMSPKIKEHLRRLGKIKVVVTDSTGIDASSERVTRRRLGVLRDPGYRITVHRRLTEFFGDIGGLLAARSAVMSASGQVKSPPDLTREQAASALKRSIESYVRFGRWDMSSPLILATATRYMRQAETQDEPPKSLILSLPMDMAVYVVAHELGHILVGHFDQPQPATTEESWRKEFVADEVATALLDGYHYQRIGAVSPSEITEQERQMLAVAINSAMIAAAVLFEVFYLFAEFARRMGMDWTKSHPPGDLRYQRFRTYNIEQLGRPEEVFSRGTGLGAPDSVQALFRELAAGTLT